MFFFSILEKFEPPEILSVKKITGIKQLLTVTWKMPEKIIPSQDLICRVQYRKSYSNSSVSYINFILKKTGSRNLTGLWDSTEYSVAIRCRSVWSTFWSEWSKEERASTEEKAPSEKVDLWRVIESSHSAGSRSVHLMWKVYILVPLNSFPPSGRILGYKIQYFPENNAALKMTNSSTDKKIILLLNEEAYIISITAYNSAGNSPEAILRIPSTDEKAPQLIETVRTFTTNEEVVVEWITSEPEVDEYVVEWYEELETEPFSRSWQYVSNSTNWKTNKRDFKPFICYNISVYPLYGTKVAAPYSIQTYVQEKKPSAGPVADTGIPGKNEVTIKWKEISKDKRNGFITNYTIFYKPEDGKELNETVNSDVLQYRLKFLQANTQYTVYIMASNGAGGTSGEPKTFKTLKFGNVLEHCFPEESQEGSLLMNCENHVSECRDINTNGMINRDTEMLYNEEAEDSKCFSPCMSYIITDQDIRSQMHSALIPAKEIQPTEVLEEDLCESQQTSIKNEENDHDEVLKLEDFSEKALFNPYLKNSVKTREFLISENLLERNKNESKSQSNVLPPCQQNATGQSYITLDMFGLSTAH
uniref:Fibronectin type-III domain-containing protein n=1 Tax=Calidris pygmaea TaxID=425635 RepID=A0A8C3J8W6_9CHAR